MHYYLQLSEGNPATDPVTLWMNGGPGCTSLKGGFEELGQLVFNRASFTQNETAAPELFYNPLGWTKLSTMLYFESPPGVGFSYCDECLGNTTCDCVADDMSTAEDNYDALVSFFKGFPELKSNEFYITGVRRHRFCVSVQCFCVSAWAFGLLRLHSHLICVCVCVCGR